MNMATSTLKTKLTIDRIMNWGNYNAVGDYSLTKPITNYKFLLFRLGSSTDQAAGGGTQYAIFPTFILAEYNPEATNGLNYYPNGKWYNIAFYFKNATTLSIVIVRNITDGNASMGNGIREIIAIA